MCRSGTAGLRSVVLLFIEVDKMGKTPMAEFKTFEEFWPYYLRAHSRPKSVPSTTLQQLLSPEASPRGLSPGRTAIWPPAC